MELSNTDVPALREILKDVEREMGVEASDDPLMLHRIHSVELQKIGWWQRLLRTGPRCEICEQPIRDVAVMFQGPFVEGLTGKFAACFDREKCRRSKETNEAIKRIETAKIVRDAFGSLVEDEEDRLNRTIG